MRGEGGGEEGRRGGGIILTPHAGCMSLPRSLLLLVRAGFIAKNGWIVCPSLYLSPDTMDVQAFSSRASAQSTYIYRVQSSVWHLQKYWLPPPSPPSECVLPPHHRRGLHTRRAVRGWRVNISEDDRQWIGLLQYNPSTSQCFQLLLQVTPTQNLSQGSLF